MDPGGAPPGTQTVFALYRRGHVGRPSVCRLDATPGGYCQLTTCDDQRNEQAVFTVPVAHIEKASLQAGTLMIRVAGRTHMVQLAPPNAAASLGMRGIGMSASGGAPAGMLAGSAVAGWGMARREKQVDPEGLRWLRLFADHGVHVEAPQRWKPRVRYALIGIAVLITVVGVLGSIIGVAEEGGWTGEARDVVVGMTTLVGLIWAVYWVTAWLLQRTVPRDTLRRVGVAPGQQLRG
jgi:hypothetical protein